MLIAVYTNPFTDHTDFKATLYFFCDMAMLPDMPVIENDHFECQCGCQMHKKKNGINVFFKVWCLLKQTYICSIFHT